MFKIEGKKIHITRGDIALIEIKVQNDDGSDYVFQKDDVIQLNVFKNKDCGCVVLTKKVKVDKEMTSVDISLTSEDTTIGDLINKPVKYWYEVILNPDVSEQTIIAYDEEGAKEFWLYPEAKEDGVIPDTPTPSPSLDLSEYFNITLKGAYDVDDGLTHASGFKAIKKLPDLTLDDNVDSVNRLFGDGLYIPKVKIKSGNAKVIDCGSMFEDHSDITEIDLSEFDTSKTTNMSYMFYYCSNLTNLDISNFNTSEVTNMDYMFACCQELTTLDLNNFNTSKVTDMNHMFYNCNVLTELDLSKFDTSNVTDMEEMFNMCYSLVNLNLNNFNTSKVLNMNSMFKECNELTALDLKNFDTSKVTDMGYMFQTCSSLIELDLSNFDVSNVTSMFGMFSGCTSLKKLIIPTFDFNNKLTVQLFGSDNTGYGDNRVPADCYILVKDATTKEWVTTNFNWLTNIHYVGE